MQIMLRQKSHITGNIWTSLDNGLPPLERSVVVGEVDGLDGTESGAVGTGVGRDVLGVDVDRRLRLALQTDARPAGGG